jgi:hypothetical protein
VATSIESQCYLAECGVPTEAQHSSLSHGSTCQGLQKHRPTHGVEKYQWWWITLWSPSRCFLSSLLCPTRHREGVAGEKGVLRSKDMGLLSKDPAEGIFVVFPSPFWKFLLLSRPPLPYLLPCPQGSRCFKSCPEHSSISLS